MSKTDEIELTKVEMKRGYNRHQGNPEKHKEEVKESLLA